jgi:hypothetical protein
MGQPTHLFSGELVPPERNWYGSKFRGDPPKSEGKKKNPFREKI